MTADKTNAAQLFHAFCNSSLQPKLLLSADCRVQAVSAAFEETFNVSEADCLGEPLYDLDGGEWDTGAVRDLLSHAASPDTLVDATETVVVGTNGAVRHVRCAATSVRSLGLEDGGYVLSVEDNTKLSSASELLRQRDNRMRNILDGAVDAIVMIDGRGRIKSFNPAAETLFGYRRDEVLGENVKMLMPSPYSDEHDAYLAQYLKTGKRKVIGIGREVVGLRKDGTEFPMELSVSQIRNTDSIQFMGTVRDLTSRKRSEHALRASEERVRAILDTAVDAIVTINSFGVIKSLNPAAQAMFGYSYEEAIGENVSMLMPSPYSEQHDSYLQNYLRTGERKVIGVGRDAVGRRKDGSTFPMELSVSEVLLDNERSFTGIVRDVSSRKRAEERLRAYTRDVEEARNQLEEQAIQLQSQADALSEARQHSEAANKTKSEFLANMSHEIRTPMTAILGFADQLADRTQTKEDANAVETIQRNGRHLIAIINDILDLSKVEAGRVEVHYEPVDLSSLIEEVAALMKVRADEKSLKLLVSNEGLSTNWILSDPARLRQILVNLLGNAVKFTDSGEVGIHARLDSSERHQGTLQIDVIDTGIGMDPEKISELFQPFTQIDESSTRRHAGTGLGLAISQRLAGLLGGKINAASQPGQGSRFTLSLDVETTTEPLRDDVEARHAEPTTTPREASGGTGRRVLVAEDGPDNQVLITYLLTKAGFEVTVVENGQEAVDAVSETADADDAFSLVIMDMQMPVLDGYAATRELRARGCRLPIVAATAHAMEGAREACLEAGCDAYLSKPFENEELQSVLDEFVGTCAAAT